jgi:hypothetical protein
MARDSRDRMIAELRATAYAWLLGIVLTIWALTRFFERTELYLLIIAAFGFFVNDIGPRTGIDYAKVLVWSFLAGFSEKLVPDVLDRLASREKK